MVTHALYIVWPLSPEVGEAFDITFRWYGLLFALGLFLAGWYLHGEFKKLGHTQSQFESLLIYLFVGIFVGARLAHCLFYEPQYYLERPLEVLLPITVQPDGSWTFSGYHGLASHGGAAGVAVALWLFCRRYKARFLPLSDILAIATMLAGAFIRLGNLCNSEIVGAPTDVPWAFVFPLYDAVPRHPAQLYESAFYLVLFGALAVWRAKTAKPAGFFFGMVMLLVGVFRFGIEFLKEVQSPFERAMTFDMGQWLSLPLVLCGAALLVWVTRRTE